MNGITLLITPSRFILRILFISEGSPLIILSSPPTPAFAITISIPLFIDTKSLAASMHFSLSDTSILYTIGFPPSFLHSFATDSKRFFLLATIPIVHPI